MYIPEKDLLSTKVIVEFTLPKLHKGKKWYVDFFAYDPSIDGMRRKKYMLDRYRTHKLREEMAFILMHNLFEKLKAGWNPWTKAKKARRSDISVTNKYLKRPKLIHEETKHYKGEL